MLIKQVSHQVGRGRLDNEVKVVGHKAKAMDLPKCFFAAFLQCGQKPFAVLVVIEDALSMVATIHEVVNRPRILDAQLARHGAEDNTEPRS